MTHDWGSRSFKTSWNICRKNKSWKKKNSQVSQSSVKHLVKQLTNSPSNSGSKSEVRKLENGSNRRVLLSRALLGRRRNPHQDKNRFHHLHIGVLPLTGNYDKTVVSFCLLLFYCIDDDQSFIPVYWVESRLFVITIKKRWSWTNFANNGPSWGFNCIVKQICNQYGQPLLYCL